MRSVCSARFILTFRNGLTGPRTFCLILYQKENAMLYHCMMKTISKSPLNSFLIMKPRWQGKYLFND
jgi:hypothetical protein